MKASISYRLLMILLLVSGIMGFVLPDFGSLGKINFILGGIGDVSVKAAGHSNWQNAKLYSKIHNGDQVKTNQESRCEIKLNDQSIVRIGEATTYQLRKDNPGRTLNSELKKGRLWANIRKISRINKFQVRTPTAVCSIRGTIYRIDADSSTKVAVYQGSVDVGPTWAVKSDSSQQQEKKTMRAPYEVPGPTQVPGPFEVTLDQWIKIIAGYQIEVRPDGKYHKSKIDEQIDGEDDWVRWNKQRDGFE